MLGLKRIELENGIDHDLRYECKDIDSMPNRDVMCRAIACAVGYAIARNNTKLHADITAILYKKTQN